MYFIYISLGVITISIILSIIAIISKTKSKCSCPSQFCQCQTYRDAFPSGTIAIWSGNINDIPNGWSICDGVNGPDLRGKFVLGQNDGKPNILGNIAEINNIILSVRTTGDVGGEETHKLTVDEIPSHTHNTQWVIPTGGNGYQPGGYDMTDNSIQPITTPTGGDKPHNNMPPYYVLAYIIKN